MEQPDEVEQIQEEVYKKFLELNVEAKVKGYKSSEGEEVFDAPTEDDTTSRNEQ